MGKKRVSANVFTDDENERLLMALQQYKTASLKKKIGEKWEFIRLAGDFRTRSSVALRQRYLNMCKLRPPIRSIGDWRKSKRDKNRNGNLDDGEMLNAEPARISHEDSSQESASEDDEVTCEEPKSRGEKERKVEAALKNISPMLASTAVLMSTEMYELLNPIKELSKEAYIKLVNAFVKDLPENMEIASEENFTAKVKDLAMLKEKFRGTFPYGNLESEDHRMSRSPRVVRANSPVEAESHSEENPDVIDLVENSEDEDDIPQVAKDDSVVLDLDGSAQPPCSEPEYEESGSRTQIENDSMANKTGNKPYVRTPLRPGQWENRNGSKGLPSGYGATHTQRKLTVIEWETLLKCEDADSIKNAKEEYWQYLFKKRGVTTGRTVSNIVKDFYGIVLPNFSEFRLSDDVCQFNFEDISQYPLLAIFHSIHEASAAGLKQAIEKMMALGVLDEKMGLQFWEDGFLDNQYEGADWFHTTPQDFKATFNSLRKNK